MTPQIPDRSRDRRIEDPTNLLIIHPFGRLLLPWFVSAGISANSVSVGGLVLGALAALAYYNWRVWPFTPIGLLLSIAWLIADGLDGMIARATNSASPLGRFLDGLCDHGVFLLLYLALAASVGTSEGWILAGCAAVLHALQSNLYESERARFHRRCKGVARVKPARRPNSIVRVYDGVGGLVDRVAAHFDEVLRRDPNPAGLGTAYRAAAAKPLRLMSLLSANVRVCAIFVACMAADPRLFWWFEILPLSAILIAGLSWHRALELSLADNWLAVQAYSADSQLTHSMDVKN